MADITSFPLDGDGIIENLYHYLWSKDEFDRSASHVRIPDTVVYRYRQPMYWYFTSKLDGTLKRKNKSNMSNAKIEKGFLSGRRSPSGIVAYYICKDDSGKRATIEFFDEERFCK